MASAIAYTAEPASERMIVNLAFWLMATLYDSDRTAIVQSANAAKQSADRTTQEYADLVAKYINLVNDYNSVRNALLTPRISPSIAPATNPTHCTSYRVDEFTYTNCY